MTTDENVKKVILSGGRVIVRHSLNGEKIFACGTNSVLKVFNAKDSEQEPETLDVVDKVVSFETSPDSKKGVFTTRDGKCYVYDLDKASFKPKLVTRSPLALRDACFTHSGSHVLCGGADGDLKLVDLQNEDDQPKVHHTADQITSISYNYTNDLAAVSLSNGSIVVLSYSTLNPSKVHLLEDLVIEKKNLDDDEEDEEEDEFDLGLDDEEETSKTTSNETEMKLSTTKCEWHVGGNMLAVPCKTREIKVYDRSNFDKLKFTFKSTAGHSKPITALKWSPNGSYLASIGLDNKLIIWSTKDKKQIKTLGLPMTCCSLSWGKDENTKNFDIIVGSNEGSVVSFQSIVAWQSDDRSSGEDLFGDQDEDEELDRILQNNGPNKFVDDRAQEDDEEEDDNDEEGDEGNLRSGVDDSLFYGQEDDFIVDDDGSGYADKRPLGSGSSRYGSSSLKRSKLSREGYPSLPVTSNSFIPATLKLKPYSPGGTPWNQNRRYLSINPLGYIWTVKQEGFNTVTVSFFDRSVNKEYFFRDTHRFDIASMNEDGILLASSGLRRGTSPVIAFRLHSNSARPWEKRILTMNNNEFITSVSLSKSTIFVCTSLGYVRKFSLYGKAERIEKTSPVVACINNEKYLVTINAPTSESLTFSIQDLEGKYLQRNEPLPLDLLSRNAYHPIKGIFFSLDGDPCIIGNDDVLLVLSRWRDPLQAIWIPILDTRKGAKSIAAGSNVKCWPLGLFKDQFNFILVRGSEFPSFPLTLPSQISVRIPLNHIEEKPTKKGSKKGDAMDLEEDEENEDDDEQADEIQEDPEEELVRCVTLGELLNDSISNDDVLDENAEERLKEYSIIYDRTLLKQFGLICADEEGETAEALEVASRLRDDRALEAARLIAERSSNGVLSRKISQLQEARMDFD